MNGKNGIIREKRHTRDSKITKRGKVTRQTDSTQCKRKSRKKLIEKNTNKKLN